MYEDIFIEISEFTRKNPSLFKTADDWLKGFDGDLDDAWCDARYGLDYDKDWLKIILVASRTYEKGIQYLLNVILAGEYTGLQHPNLTLLQRALDDTKKANQ